jgi:hypothetical protein
MAGMTDNNLRLAALAKRRRATGPERKQKLPASYVPLVRKQSDKEPLVPRAPYFTYRHAGTSHRTEAFSTLTVCASETVEMAIAAAAIARITNAVKRPVRFVNSHF